MTEIIEWVKNHLVLTIYSSVSTLIIFALAVSLFYQQPSETESMDEMVEQLMSDTEIPAESEVVDIETEGSQTTNTDTVVVEIKGALVSPGVYELKTGDRLVDAIELAGGLTEKADDRTINQALLLTDQMMIYVPFQGEEVSETSQVATVNGMESSTKININKAEINELTDLNGIGDSRAQSIIDYRVENGLFKTIEEIKNVSGIGDKIFENLKEQITVD